MRKMFILLGLMLAGCGGNHLDYLRMRDIPPPTVEEFTHCYNYGCQKRVLAELPEKTQKKLDKLFAPTPKTAEDEQTKISKAIQIFEQDVGALTGTENDKHGTFRLYQTDDPKARKFQQDCVDESTNTTIYLTLLDTMGYLKFHSPAFPTNRQPFLGGAAWWHQTAVIQNNETGEKFVVDSWFRDNGHPAFVVPIQEWKDGWSPPKPDNKVKEKG